MTTAVAPEVAALEAFLLTLEKQDQNMTVLDFIQAHWPVAASSKILDFMLAIAALRQLSSELPTAGMRAIGLKTADALLEAFNTHSLGQDVAFVRANLGRQLHLAISTLEIFHELQFDREGLTQSRGQIDEAIDDLLAKFAQSSLSDASKSVLTAQLQLLKGTLDRFEAGSVTAFRASAYSVIGRVVFEIKRDKRLNPEDARDLIDDIMRVADVIELGGKILSLAAPVTMLLLSGPK